MNADTKARKTADNEASQGALSASKSVRVATADMTQTTPRNMAKEFCSDVRGIAEAESVESAVECITRLNPDIVRP